MSTGRSSFRRNQSKGPVVDTAEFAPRPVVPGTVIFVVTLFFTGIFVKSGVPNPARLSAITVGIALVVSVFLDFRAGGVRNLVRTDLFTLLALYFLTLFEFLFPQEEFHHLANPVSVPPAVILVLWALGGLAVGRHLANLRRHPFANIFVRPVEPKFLVFLFVGAAALGYAHMLIAVNFDVMEMIHFFLEPRFSQPWQRGRLGDWKALLVELGLLIYLLPPLAGVIFARRTRYSKGALFLVGFLFLFTLFYGFTSGTRNVFASYVLTFLIGYSFALSADRKRELVVMGVVCAVVLLVSTILMLEFRTVGITNYFQGATKEVGSPERSLYVDYNLYAITMLVEVFPARHPYLGWEIPWNALIRPIPRALWKGKPEGLSMSIEDAVGAEGWTVAASMVGEAYMMAGTLGVIGTALFFGFITGWWGHLASPRNSDFGNLVYASGFFAAAISMRSLFTFSTAILPTLGALVVGALLIKKVRESKQENPFRR